MKRLDEIENLSIYIVREAYSYLEKIITLGWIRKDTTVLFVLFRKSFQGTVPFSVNHAETNKKRLNAGKTSTKNGPWYGAST
jgi:sulfate adenylyltransferase subunit 2